MGTILFWIILFAVTTFIPIAVFLFTDTTSSRNKKYKCVYCKQQTYIPEKDVCTNCHKTIEGEVMEEDYIREVNAISPEELKSKKRSNRILILIFSTLALAALGITLYRLFK